MPQHEARLPRDLGQSLLSLGSVSPPVKRGWGASQATGAPPCKTRPVPISPRSPTSPRAEARRACGASGPHREGRAPGPAGAGFQAAHRRASASQGRPSDGEGRGGSPSGGSPAVRPPPHPSQFPSCAPPCPRAGSTPPGSAPPPPAAPRLPGLVKGQSPARSPSSHLYCSPGRVWCPPSGPRTSPCRGGSWPSDASLHAPWRSAGLPRQLPAGRASWARPPPPQSTTLPVSLGAGPASPEP